MRTVLVLLASIAVSSAFLDYSMVSIDRRLRNDDGQVNPYRFVRRAIALTSQFGSYTPNEEAWKKYQKFLLDTYGKNNATKIENLSNTVVDTLNTLPKVAQSMVIGQVIDLWNLATYGYLKTNPTMIQANTALFLVRDNWRNVIVPSISTIFYNPFDTELISTLNASDVYSIKFGFLTGRLTANV